MVPLQRVIEERPEPAIVADLQDRAVKETGMGTCCDGQRWTFGTLRENVGALGFISLQEYRNRAFRYTRYGE